jgi:hypothetical protein
LFAQSLALLITTFVEVFVQMYTGFFIYSVGMDVLARVCSLVLSLPVVFGIAVM